MKTARPVSYKDLSKADLVVDAVYEASGTQLSGEAISKLLGTANKGGFRVSGRGKDKKFIVLYTTGEDKDWPDQLDLNTGQFLYYGDNKKPGTKLESTPLGGNSILEHVFNLLHLDVDGSNRSRIPPFFVFRKYPTMSSSLSVQFKGLAVPGFPDLPSTEDLVAVWKTSNRERFQNYLATFTILDAAVITRAWLHDLRRGDAVTKHAPGVWVEWIRTGRYRPLVSENTRAVRIEEEQLPDTPGKEAILETVWEYFRKKPREFEFFASRLFRMQDQRTIIDEITRASVDGGRDAVGRYRLGLTDDPIYVEFSLEAKCYQPPLNGQKPNRVGVKDISRLISRLRHRQFGVLVTTSVIGRQAYEEVRNDRHPVIFFCGKDIADILINTGLNTPKLVKAMLEKEFPVILKKT